MLWHGAGGLYCPWEMSIFACFSVAVNCWWLNWCPLLPANNHGGICWVWGQWAEVKPSKRALWVWTNSVFFWMIIRWWNNWLLSPSSPSPVSLSRCRVSPLSDIDLIKVKGPGSDEDFKWCHVSLAIRMKILSWHQIFICLGVVLILILSSVDEGHLFIAAGHELLVIRKLIISGNSFCVVWWHTS